jgi:hypothetical protein
MYLTEADLFSKMRSFYNEDTTYIFQRRGLRSVHYQAEVRSLEDRLDFVNVRFPFVTGAAYGVENPYPMYGCSIEHDEYGPQESVFTIELSRTLGFGETHCFSLGFYVLGDQTVVRIRTPLIRRDTATLRLQFDEPLPYRVVVEGKDVILDGGGYYWESWHEFGGAEKVTYVDLLGDDDLLDELMSL